MTAGVQRLRCQSGGRLDDYPGGSEPDQALMGGLLPAHVPPCPPGAVITLLYSHNIEFAYLIF